MRWHVSSPTGLTTSFTSTRPILTGPGDYVPGLLSGYLDELSANGTGCRVCDNPWMLKQGWFFLTCRLPPGRGWGRRRCGLPRHEALAAERNPTLDHLTDYPLMTALDLRDAVCADMCQAVEGNVLVYHDAHHLSATGVRTLTRRAGRQPRGATRWW